MNPGQYYSLFIPNNSTNWLTWIPCNTRLKFWEDLFVCKMPHQKTQWTHYITLTLTQDKLNSCGRSSCIWIDSSPHWKLNYTTQHQQQSICEHYPYIVIMNRSEQRNKHWWVQSHWYYQYRGVVGFLSTLVLSSYVYKFNVTLSILLECTQQRWFPWCVQHAGHGPLKHIMQVQIWLSSLQSFLFYFDFIQQRLNCSIGIHFKYM